jgi:hypothetical protein
MSPILHALPEDRDQRWELMRGFFAHWYTPIAQGQGYSDHDLATAERRLGFGLPAALCEWYRLAGRRGDVWSTQDVLLAPEKLHVVSEVLVFYHENQCAVRWGVPVSMMNQDDPPVVIEDYESNRRWINENRSVSEFALQMLLFAVKSWDHNACWANGAGNDSALRCIEQSYPRLPFPDWHWPSYPTRLFGSDNIIIETNGCAGDSWIWVNTKSDEAFRNFERLMSETELEWEACSDWDG